MPERHSEHSVRRAVRSPWCVAAGAAAAFPVRDDGGSRRAVADNSAAPRQVTDSMELRRLTRNDLRLYERVYTDPRMWLELGGVVEQDMVAKLERDVASVQADRHWVLVIVTEEGAAAGTVALWDHEWEGETIDEIGWMVLPEHQGRGLASAAVAEALRRADEAVRWRVLHAFPAATNAPRTPSAADTDSPCAARSTTPFGTRPCASTIGSATRWRHDAPRLLGTFQTLRAACLPGSQPGGGRATTLHAGARGGPRGLANA